MKKVAALLAIVLLFSLVGCSGSAAVDDIPSSNIESQTPSETPEETPSTQAPSQSEEPATSTQEPIASEELPEETIAPTMEPTSPPASSVPVSTSDPSSAPSTPAPTHTHSYTSSITKQATCAEEGAKTFTCSTCGNKYNETIGKTNDHNWSIRHVDEIGHMESNGTHRVTFKRHDCGFEVNGDMPNAAEIWRDHTRECDRNYILV